MDTKRVLVLPETGARSVQEVERSLDLEHQYSFIDQAATRFLGLQGACYTDVRTIWAGKKGGRATYVQLLFRDDKEMEKNSSIPHLFGSVCVVANSQSEDGETYRYEHFDEWLAEDTVMEAIRLHVLWHEIEENTNNAIARNMGSQPNSWFIVGGEESGRALEGIDVHLYQVQRESHKAAVRALPLRG